MSEELIPCNAVRRWVRPVPDYSPSPRSGHVSAADPTTKSLWIFGGYYESAGGFDKHGFTEVKLARECVCVCALYSVIATSLPRTHRPIVRMHTFRIVSSLR